MCNNNSINSDEKSSVLIDKTKSGKIRPWREKKMGSVAELKLYAHLYKTIKANIVLTVKSFVSINYFSFFSINIT
uniref:hypothetical protein n=1 Tax=Mammaliicoccus lentus TaxID=42858 RepID=UPI00155DAE6F|nr:hypothetical protein [Mammaliicoccus lentus]